MGIIYQRDKRVGITYVYESESYWDKVKQQPRSRRKLIGRLDKKTGEIIATRKYTKKSSESKEEPPKPEPVPMTKIQRSFYGATYLHKSGGMRVEPSFILVQTHTFFSIFPQLHS